MASTNALIRFVGGEATTRALPRELARLICHPRPATSISSPSSLRSRLPRFAAVRRPMFMSASSLSSSSSSPRPIVTLTPRISLGDDSNGSSSQKKMTTMMPTTETEKNGEGGIGRVRSPHSKLLRVCSERNANPHFAAIEADMIRLNWHDAMDDLVEDWSGKGRFGDFIELESTVRRYVCNNMIDLAHYERECSREWEDDGARLGRAGIALSDIIRHRLFPYERVVTASIRNAISAIAIVSPHSSTSTHRGGEDARVVATSVREGIARMSTSGRLLDAMTAFDGTIMMDDENDDDGIENGDDGLIDDDNGWTDQHEACSRCYRLIVSGWLLLHRRFGESNDVLMLGSSSLSAADIIGSTKKSDVHPQVETRVWTEKWIDFCDRRRHGGGGHAIPPERGASSGWRGILPSDEPLLMGVARMISSCASGRHVRHRTKAARLNDRIRGLFSGG
ncbi:hypothetical protein ACHAXA_006732 [Cyclostephanos tholiformis]|uniref:Uncharacterized protein n=1 Tax=Cyclostephanos tholiformis TaxID=382380 RepID=A0ABD3SRE9_9STRA